MDNKQFTLGIAVTEVSEGATAGDYFTAKELGIAIEKTLGWKVKLLPKYQRRSIGRIFEDVFSKYKWHDLSGLDALLVLVDEYDLKKALNVNPTLKTIAWMRNWFSRWPERKSFNDYDIYLCSSNKSKSYIEEKYSKKVEILRLAANMERFKCADQDEQRTLDYCFTGSFWNTPREIEQLEPENVNASFELYGSGWSRHEKFRKYWKGFLPYERLPEVYAKCKMLVDDANHVTKPWGSLNSRVYDAISAGVLVVTNCVEGAQESFGDALPTYNNVAELKSLVEYYSVNKNERHRRVKMLRDILEKKHLYTHRAETLRNILANYNQTS